MFYACVIQNVAGVNISTCVVGNIGNITDICSCDTSNNASNLHLNCIFRDNDTLYDASVSGDVTSFKFRGKHAMTILENITKSSNTANVTGIDVQANEDEFNITYDFLAKYPALQTIRLHNCSIIHIESKTFSDHKNLTSVDLSGNSFLTLRAVVDSFENIEAPFLENLNLSGIHNAEDMPTTSLAPPFFEHLAETQLRVLDISWIRITLITGSFVHLEHLKVINLTGTTVLGEVDCMSTLLSLRQVETMVLNFWPTLPRGYQSIIYLPEPEYRYKRSINCGLFPLFNYTSFCYSMLPSVRTLHLRGIDLDSFYVDFTIESICFQYNELLNFMISGSRVSKQIGRFRGFNRLKFFDSSDLVSSFQGPIFNPDIFSDMTDLEVLLISGCRLYEFSQAQLSSMVSKNRLLKVLDISSNRLSSLPTDIFAGNENLEVVDISDNNLADFNVDLSEHYKLRRLDLSSNKLQSIADSVFEDVKEISVNSTLTINLQDNNSLRCTCNIINLVSMVTNQSVVECQLDGKVYRVGNYTDEDLPDELQELCNRKSKGLSVVSIFAIAFGSLFVVVVASAVIFCLSKRNSGNIRNNLTLITLPGANRRRLKEPKFTVFLAYCYKDYDFAVLKLYPIINKKLKALFKRDDDNLIVVNDSHFLPGVNIDVLIANAIQESFVTLAVISKDFLESSWCQYEVLKTFTENIPLIPLYISKLDPRELKGIYKELYYTRCRLMWPCDPSLPTSECEKAEKDTIELLCNSIVGHVMQTKRCIEENRKRQNLEPLQSTSTSLPRFTNGVGTSSVIRY